MMWRSVRCCSAERARAQAERIFMAYRRNQKILVVDDDNALRTLCTDTLERAGYEVESASNGVEALRLLRSEGFDLVVSDVEMPGLDGLSLLSRALDECGLTSDTFLMVTGNLTGESRTRMEEHGVEYLTKPYRLSELLRSVESKVGAGDPESYDRKRREKRFNWQEDCFVTEDVLNIPVYSQTLDISRSGLKIRFAGKPLSPESALRVYIRNPGIKARGRIVWSRPINETESVAGLQFSEPLPTPSLGIIGDEGA